MIEQRDKYIVEAIFRNPDEQDWDWLTEAFGATYCETEPQAMAIARFLSTHPAVEMVEVLYQKVGRRLESIWASDPRVLKAAKDRLSRISDAADFLGVDNPAFAEWLVMERKSDEY
jgi:hypothetical protein